MLRRVAIALPWMLLAATMASAGLVRNADFSAKSGGDRPSLTAWNMPDKGGFAAVNDDGRSGSDSLRYKFAIEATGASVWQEIECKPDTEYVLTAAFKTDGNLRPCVVVIGPEGKILAQTTAADDRQWTLHTAAFNTQDAKKLRIEIDADVNARNGGTLAAGTCWIDDVNVVTPEEAKSAGAKVAGYRGPAIGANIALGKPYTLQPEPGYSYSADPGDTVQLTDGKRSVGYFWTQKETVGWNSGPAQVTIDLGQDQPIKGASYSTAAGVAGVAWPTSIQLFVSDDGKMWYGAGDLITHAAKFGLPEDLGYSTFTFVADDLNTHGRYLRLIVTAPSYIFCDEIEVYKGADALLTTERGKGIADMKDYLRQQRVKSGIMRRLQRDLAAVEDLAARTKLSASERAKTDRELEQIRAQMQEPLADVPASYRAIHPLAPVHERLLTLSASLYRARGYKPVTLW